MSTGFTPVFTGTGTGHRAGAVPDPGPSTPSDYVLRADATWGAQTAGAMQSGKIATVSIAPGAASATAGLSFAPPFTSAPTVVVTTDDETLMGSVSGVTLDGFIAHLTAATPVVVATAANIYWMAI